MIKTIIANGKTEYEVLAGLAGRGDAPGADVEEAVRKIVEDVRTEGDAAVVRYTLRFDGPDAAPDGKIGTLTRKELKEAFESLDKPLADAILHSAENIRSYHKKQADSLNGYEEKSADGVVRGQMLRGLERVGVYVPGGTAAYPSTVLMDVIPAKLAGVGEIVMVTPPRRGKAGDKEGCAAGEGIGEVTSADGGFATDAAILGAAYIAGVDRVLLAGGGQAVAALAYGTETFPRVDKIVGPGNIYVATAKRLLYGVVDIEMIAGPSEILIIADESADAAFAAADLLSQAEHDPLSASILLTTDPDVAAAAARQVVTQLKSLDRAYTAQDSLSKNGLIIVCRSEDEMVSLANHIAPEHLEILTADPFALLTRIKNAGSVFLGPWTPEPVGDYYAGTNHVLPTGGAARFASPLGVYDFVKRTSYTHYPKDVLLRAKDDIIAIAEAEGLTAHAQAVKIRFNE
ncbi:MAG: histidinol dehydrogenase [Clostridiales bacterium]|nr:histidinol dehydrogenase [Clostridiales bacterium]